jgi:hypothetical protein
MNQMAQKFVLSSHTEEEKKASCDLITECFGDWLGATYEKEYNWLFQENPAGTGSILIAYDGMKPVGQVCSIPCKYAFNDRYISTAIAGEWICVSPSYRGKGIMSQLIRRIVLENNGCPFVLDLPNKASMNGFLRANYRQMSSKLLTKPVKLSRCFVYKNVPKVILGPFDRIWKNRRSIHSGKSVIKEYTSPEFDFRFDEFFKDVDDSGMIKQVRNSEFLNWRYRKSQTRNYLTLVSIGENGKLDGYIIFRVAVAYMIRVGFIMEFFIKGDSENGKNLVRYALNYFWENDVAVAAALCFPNCIEYKILRKEGFFICPNRLRPNPYTLCVRPSTNGQNQFDTNMLMDSTRWLFMFGDFQVY